MSLRPHIEDCVSPGSNPASWEAWCLSVTITACDGGPDPEGEGVEKGGQAILSFAISAMAPLMILGDYEVPLEHTCMLTARNASTLVKKPTQLCHGLLASSLNLCHVLACRPRRMTQSNSGWHHDGCRRYG